VSASDPDAEPLTESYTWTNSTTGASLGIGATISLNSTVASRGDAIVCAVDVTDSSGGSVSDTSTTLLQNRAPSTPTVTLDPSTAYIDTTLTCTASGSSDADGDGVSYSYAWSVNGVSLSDSGMTLSAAFAADDIVTCTVTPSDGLLSGTAGETSIIISNSIPSVDSVSLSPDPLYTDNLVSASASASDSDGDTLTLYYTWSVNGAEVQTGTGSSLAASFFAKGDGVSVAATADDGSAISADLMASITCNNTAPTTPGISITPETPMSQSDELQCLIDTVSSDVDSDTISYTFSWAVDGTPYTGTTTDSVYSGDTIPSSETYVGDWECSVTPNDGSTDGSTATSTVTVGVSDPCANYGGTAVDINSNIKVCSSSMAWGQWNNSLIPGGWQVCTTSQWSAYAPSATPSSFGLASLWIDNSSCGSNSHREVFVAYPMNDSNCYNGGSCCWDDSTVLQFAICSP